MLNKPQTPSEVWDSIKPWLMAQQVYAEYAKRAAPPYFWLGAEAERAG